MSAPSIQSNYWKISHHDDQYSTFYIPTNTSLSKEQDTIAVGSNFLTENLKIYQLYANSLIHLASITLPDIQSLKFLKPITQPPHDFKFLITGHSNGIAHLSAIPLADNSVFENAEIIKRLNHKKHLKSTYPDAVSRAFYNNNNTLSTTITSIELTGNAWSSTPLNSLVSVYDNHLFLWDTSRSRAPLSMVRTNGITSVSLNNNMDSLAAIVGDFGLSLLDLRTSKNRDKSSLYVPPRQPTSRSCSNSSMSASSTRHCNGFTSAQWCETDANHIATIQNDIVYIWDIRKQEPFTKLTGFSDSVTQVRWSGNTLWTADKDGYLIDWNMKHLQNLENMTCTISSNSDLGALWNSNYSTENNTICRGNSNKVSNTKIIAMEMDYQTENIVCLDNSFLSTHELESRSRRIHPQIVEKVSFDHNDSVSGVPPKRVDSAHSESSQHSQTTQLFDSPSSSRKTSNESYTNTAMTNQTREIDAAGDYLDFFQKEIDEMIETIDHINVNDTVF